MKNKKEAISQLKENLVALGQIYIGGQTPVQIYQSSHYQKIVDTLEVLEKPDVKVKKKAVTSDTDKRQGGELRDWMIRGRCFMGYIHGDDKYEDGTFITTSRAIRFDLERRTLETLNTIYTLEER